MISRADVWPNSSICSKLVRQGAKNPTYIHQSGQKSVGSYGIGMRKRGILVKLEPVIWLELQLAAENFPKQPETRSMGAVGGCILAKLNTFQRRKLRVEPWEPTWFQQRIDPVSGEKMYFYRGNYWSAKEKQDWSKCPAIFD